ncbi:hypothetical protein GCM10027402_17700 [Arthrobacter monumenti]
MRPGSIFASVCLMLLASVNFTEQSYVIASVLAVLSLVFLVVGLGFPRAAARRPKSAPSSGEMLEAQHEHHRNARGWRYIALGGMVLSVVGVFVFPPMSLVVAALSVYSVYRMRKSNQSADRLGSTLPKVSRAAN